MRLLFNRIKGLRGLYVECLTKHYDYDDHKNRAVCPVCGGPSWVWGGWVTCDAGEAQNHIALVGSGQVFIKYTGVTP